MANESEPSKTKITFGVGQDIEWSELEPIYEGIGKLTSGSNTKTILKKMKKLVDKHLS